LTRKNILVLISVFVILSNIATTGSGYAWASERNKAQSQNSNLEFSLRQPSKPTKNTDNDVIEGGNYSSEQKQDLKADAKASEGEATEQGVAADKKEEAIEEQAAVIDKNEINTEPGKPSPDSNSTPALVKLLQGQVTYTVPTGTPIKLKLANVPSHPISLMDRDFDGNLYPARLGQKITARTTEDIYIEHNKIIPEGTIFYGEVARILPPRRLSRPGSLELSFNELITPDGRKFAFHVEADNHKQSTLKTKAKGFGIIAAYAAGGAITGALVAYEVFGLEKTIAMHGYNIAGGAAAGALLATGYAIMRKGPKATLEPGDDLNMCIDNDLLMPVAVEVDKNKVQELTDVKIEIEKSKIVGDGVGGHFVTIDATVVNDSDQDLSSIDLFLQDTNGNKHPVCSSPDEESQFLFNLEAHSQRHLHISFLTPYPKLKQQLVWLDHNTKLALVRQKIQ